MSGVFPVLSAEIVLIALAALFAALALRSRLRGDGPNPARKAWLRTALIFSAVAIGLFVWRRFVP